MYIRSNLLFSFHTFKGKLQITLLKFGSVGILYHKVLEIEFTPLSLGLFGFYILTFQNLDFTP